MLGTPHSSRITSTGAARPATARVPSVCGHGRRTNQTASTARPMASATRARPRNFRILTRRLFTLPPLGISSVQAGTQARGEDGDVGLGHQGDVAARQLVDLGGPGCEPAPPQI